MPDETPSVSINRKLTTEVVAAYVRRNQVTSNQPPVLTPPALASLGKPVAELNEQRTPAVPIRRSVHRDYVVCLECGWRGQMLKRHLAIGHGSSAPISCSVEPAREHLLTAPRLTRSAEPGLPDRSASGGIPWTTGAGRTRKRSRTATRSRRRGRPRSAATST
jgi:hypothetical protein